MENSVNDGKATAITGYILIIGVLIAISMNSETKNQFASFHIRQALGLSITFISLGLIISNFQNPSITISMWIFMSVLWGFGLFSAIRGEMQPVPLVGKIYQKLFKSIS